MPNSEEAFSFGQPVYMFPDVLERLRGTPARAEDMVADMPERFLVSRLDNRWSVKEHIGHLADLQGLEERRLREFLDGAAVLSPADMNNRATEIANHNQTPVGVLFDRLRGVRAAWLSKLEGLAEADLLRTALHPRLQQGMQLVDWLCFIAEHDDHHLARISELLKLMNRVPATARDLFEIPDGITYLNCANMAPQLRSVTAAGLNAVRAKATPWTLSSAGWFAGAEELRALASQLLGDDPHAIALVPAASYGIAIAAANVRVQPGQSIVILDQEFPSNVYAWRELARKQDAKVVTVRRATGQSWTEALLDAVNDRTAVVAIPQCHWIDGGLIDLIRVGQRSRQVNAALIIDASQSLGACPLNVNAVQPDFLVSVGYKWLLGPYGLGYLYVAPQWRDRAMPLEHSWLTRAGSEDFARLIEYRDDYRPGARRFDMGEFPQFVSVPMAITALRQVLAWGVESIEQALSVLTGHVAQRATQAGYSVLPPEQRCGHMIGIRLSGGIPDTLSASLAAAGIYVSIRGDSIRIAPHLYNDTSDIDRFFKVLAECVPS